MFQLKDWPVISFLSLKRATFKTIEHSAPIDVGWHPLCILEIPKKAVNEKYDANKNE